MTLRATVRRLVGLVTLGAAGFFYRQEIADEVGRVDTMQRLMIRPGFIERVTIRTIL
jgi:hypothetical protein